MTIEKVTRSQLGIKPNDQVEVTLDDGTKKIMKARTAPWQLGHGEWVVGLEGISGGYLLSRCKRV